MASSGGDRGESPASITAQIKLLSQRLEELEKAGSDVGHSESAGEEK
jgi:hypothetical protein